MFNRTDYCQFMLSTQINYTLTYFAEHAGNFSHDLINRYLSNTKLTSRIVWEHVENDCVFTPRGCIIFDDSVLDKNHSHKIDLVRRQYSGNVHGLIKGIGMVNCLYVNPHTGHYWVLDYRIYDPRGDGKSKLTHVKEMLVRLVADKGVLFNRVLIDTWYATKDLLLFIESLGKVYYAPVKGNRLVDDSGGVLAYKHVDELKWTEREINKGKTVKIKEFPKLHKVKLFRVVVSDNRTEMVVTNDLAQCSASDVQNVCAIRWKIEQFHREVKQLTGIEKCQCRKARIQRNHIACAVLVWIRLTALARKGLTTVYQIKHGLLSNFLRSELRSPTVRFATS